MRTHLLGCVQSSSWLLMSPLMPETRASHPLGGVRGGSSADWETQNSRGDFPLTCVTVPVCHLSDSVLVMVGQKRSIPQRMFAKSYNISQVLNPGVTTSKTAHFSERVRDVPVTAWPLWTLLYACCGAQSVPYWKLKWQTGWGKRVFSFSYLVRSVHPTQHMCQQCCHLDLNQLPQVCSAGSKELIT